MKFDFNVGDLVEFDITYALPSQRGRRYIGVVTDRVYYSPVRSLTDGSLDSSRSERYMVHWTFPAGMRNRDGPYGGFGRISNSWYYRYQLLPLSVTDADNSEEENK